jgi:cytochrome c2
MFNQTLINRQKALCKKNLEDLRLLTTYGVLGDTCWASDSGKPVFKCWCSQCHELVQMIRDGKGVPMWAMFPEMA